MNIEQLQGLFKSPLKEYERRKIVFWFDEDQVYSEEVKEIHIEGVKVHVYDDTNNFYTKYLIEVEDKESNYLLYCPIKFSSIKDQWLLDMKLYSYEYRADDISMILQEFIIDDSFRGIVNDYKKLFTIKKYSERLKKYNDLSNLKVSLLASVLGCNDNKELSILKMLMKKDVFKEVSKFKLEETLKEVLYKELGYQDILEYKKYSEFMFLNSIKEELDVSTLINSSTKVESKIVLEELLSEDVEVVVGLSNELYNTLELGKNFTKVEDEELIKIQYFKEIDDLYLKRVITKVLEKRILSVSKIDTAISYRRKMQWYQEYEDAYLALLYAVKMIDLVDSLDFYSSSSNEVWNKYKELYYKVDQYYRLFNYHFSEYLLTYHSNLDELKALSEYLNHMYINKYLDDLGLKWDSFIESSFDTLVQPKQSNFYNDYVAAASEKCVVIISDALRYEVAEELKQVLSKELSVELTLDALVGITPTITSFGMSALLPFKELTYSEGIKIDGYRSDKSNREQLLKNRNEHSLVVNVNDFLMFKKNEQSALLKGKEVTYMYHNVIDARGDHALSEKEVFKACKDSIKELTKVVSTLRNLSISNIIVTADHGFIYTIDTLEAFDKVNYPNMNMIENGRRYAITEENSNENSYLKRKVLNTNLYAYYPRGYLRFKKPGGGANYVHGGLSLQEVMIPCLSIKTIRRASKNYVENKVVEIDLVDQTKNEIRNASTIFKLYQVEQMDVYNHEGLYEVYLVDEKGNVISDIDRIVANKTGDINNRLIDVKLTLRSAVTSSRSCFLVIKNSKNKEEKKYLFDVNIAFGGHDLF